MDSAADSRHQQEMVVLELDTHHWQTWEWIRLDQALTDHTSVAVFLLTLYEKCRHGDYPSVFCTNCCKPLPRISTLCSGCTELSKQSTTIPGSSPSNSRESGCTSAQSPQVEGQALSDPPTCGNDASLSPSTEPLTTDQHPVQNRTIQTATVHSCKLCDKTFSSSDAWSKHTVWHSTLSAATEVSISKTGAPFGNDTHCQASLQTAGALSKIKGMFVNQGSDKGGGARSQCGQVKHSLHSRMPGKKKKIEITVEGQISKDLKRDNADRGQHENQISYNSEYNKFSTVQNDNKHSEISENVNCSDSVTTDNQGAENTDGYDSIETGHRQRILSYMSPEMIPLSTAHGDRPFMCQACGASYTTSSHLRTHVRSHAAAASHFQCEHCAIVCQDTAQLQQHTLLHAQHKPFQCSVCPMAFTRAAYLKVHTRSAHTGEKPYKCLHCAVAYADARNLKVHMRKHTGDRPFLCHQCGQSFADACVLSRHRRSHTGRKPFHCKTCGAAFTNAGSLTYHHRRHQGLKLYLCHKCGASFTSSSQLAKHQKAHCNLRPFTCPDCGAKFSRAQTLQIHSRNHSGQKNLQRVKGYTCQYCQAVYTDNRNFVRHIRVHTGEKPHVCGSCDAAFAQPGDLKKHELIHSGLKPYSCPHCQAAFRHSSGLTVHLRIHSGDRPYQCQHCHLAFVSSSKLASHVRARHKPL